MASGVKYLKLVADLYIPSEEAEEGQGMVEYGLILALVSIVAVGALFFLGERISEVFSEVTGELD